MSKITKFLVIIMPIIVLTGCQTFKMVESNQATTLGNLQITPMGAWSQYNSGDKSVEVLTRDGHMLNVLSVSNVKDGEHVYKEKVTDTNKGFIYKKSMLLDEAIELYLDALNASHVFNVDVLDESETTLSGNPAIKLEFTYDTEFGLTYQHQVLITKNNDELEILNCYAPQEHYYEVLAPEFRSIIASATIAP